RGREPSRDCVTGPQRKTAGVKSGLLAAFGFFVFRLL
ncbi:MAG: hypothetical protein QOI23_1800, partial [Chloroflexota bacterium]|nr:hypothetical protein [Chloroflexota bacterium]